MRTKKELESPEFNDSMTPLIILLKKRKIPYKKLIHAGAEAGVKELIGYYPSGKWHIIIRDTYSVIRGMVSFGMFEVMNIKDGALFKEPERFRTAEELVDALESPSSL